MAFLNSKRMYGVVAASAALLLGLALAVPIRAQVIGATLSGAVTDPSGAVLPGAKVAIRNTATGVTTSVTANAAGLYTAPNLIPGPYRVTVSAHGFQTVVHSGITLTVGAQQVLNVSLPVGAVTQTVQVTGQAPAVQLVTSSISADVNSTKIRQLPLNGRSWTDLAELQPGVAVITTQAPFNHGGNRGNRGFGSEIAISGERPQFNNYRLDGVSLNGYANGSPGAVLGGTLGVDAIQEFSVLTSNYSAEYGRTAGGVVNAITKSGTNQFHGDAYEFLRNDALDAANFFDNFGNSPKPPFRRNQFGVSAGGPIRKNKAFIFGDYEGIRQVENFSNTATMPTAAARAGNLCSNPAGAGSTPCTPTTVTVDPGAAKYLGLFAIPNGPSLGNGDIGEYFFPAPQIVSENFFTTRFDNRFSDKDSLDVTYMYDDSPFSSPDGANVQLIGDHSNRSFATLSETHIFSPSLVNTVRAGYNRDGVLNNGSISAINPLAAQKGLGTFPGTTPDEIQIGGITEMKGGLNQPSSYIYHWNSWQGYDDAFLMHGTHSIKFGGGVERIQLNMIALGNGSGSFKFGNLLDFLTNAPSSFASQLPGTLTPRGERQTRLGVYVQDDWRARPNLTLNLGLRYEITSVPTEVQNKLSNLIHITDATQHLGNPYFLNPTLHNFEPRIGFAWDPFHNGKTAIRGGWGLFDVLPLPYQNIDLILQSSPFFEQGTVPNPPAGSFYQSAAALLTASTLRQAFIQYNDPRQYVMEWNFDIQRTLTPSTTLTVAYVAGAGVHLPFRNSDFNNVLPKLTPAGFLWPNPSGSGTVMNPAFGQIDGTLFFANSNYNSVEVSLQKRMSHGLQAQGSFTWGKSMDDDSSTVQGDQFGNSIPGFWNWQHPSVTRAVSDYNQTDTLVLNANWEVPGLKSASGPVNWIANGWELGGIYTLNSGVPFTATFGTDADPLGELASHPQDYPDRLTGPGCNSLVNPGNPNSYMKVQCFSLPTAPSMAYWRANCDQTPGLYPGLNPTGPVPFPYCMNLAGNSGRNIMTGPSLSDLDFSLIKNNHITRISENFNVQFRLEVFNILNRPNFLPPLDNTDIFDSTGALLPTAGLIDATADSSRQIQFALKVIW
ncbi:MAG: TonB-dependent receptor [Terriglobia bacterium]